ncbi:pyridoxal 5'-phosphate synthase, partial [Brucella sp. 10RB9212]
FPSGRFVDLKKVDRDGFVFCTYLDSQKGIEINNNPKVALTIWWDHVNYQIRVIGVANKLESSEAKKYWENRSFSAKVTTTVCDQSQRLDHESLLEDKFNNLYKMLKEERKDIPKPDNWGGYCITPLKIEFLTFKDSRLHLRELYEAHGKEWSMQLLQP